MKFLFNSSFICLSALMIIACQNTPQKENVEAAPATLLINDAIKAHGTDILEKATISFDFRDKEYTATRSKYSYTYTRSFQDSLGFIQDSLVNSTIFSRHINGVLIDLDSIWESKYANSVNSVLYFFLVPQVLHDGAARQELLADVKIKGKTYHQLSITFGQEGGGKDFEDEFLYWINKQTKEIDYFAYNYITDGGGVRFREAINKRVINGLLVQDYVNLKPSEKTVPLVRLPALYEAGQLEELSRIINNNVRVITN